MSALGTALVYGAKIAICAGVTFLYGYGCRKEHERHKAQLEENRQIALAKAVQERYIKEFPEFENGLINLSKRQPDLITPAIYSYLLEKVHNNFSDLPPEDRASFDKMFADYTQKTTSTKDGYKAIKELIASPDESLKNLRAEYDAKQETQRAEYVGEELIKNPMSFLDIVKKVRPDMVPVVASKFIYSKLDGFSNEEKDKIVNSFSFMIDARLSESSVNRGEYQAIVDAAKRRVEVTNPERDLAGFAAMRNNLYQKTVGVDILAGDVDMDRQARLFLTAYQLEIGRALFGINTKQQTYQQLAEKGIPSYHLWAGMLRGYSNDWFGKGLVASSAVFDLMCDKLGHVGEALENGKNLERGDTPESLAAYDLWKYARNNKIDSKRLDANQIRKLMSIYETAFNKYDSDINQLNSAIQVKNGTHEITSNTKLKLENLVENLTKPSSKKEVSLNGIQRNAAKRKFEGRS